MILNNVPGIYCVFNKVNFKAYVGSTNKLRTRMHDHFNLLKKQLHRNSYLQNAFNKYGIDAFDFIPLESCPVPELLKREKYWIETYKATNRNYGYNLKSDPERNTQSEETKEKIRKARTGWKHTAEDRLHMSLAHKGHNIPEAAKTAWKKWAKTADFGYWRGKSGVRGKKIIQLDSNGKEIKEYISARVAANNLGKPNLYKHISAVCKGSRASAGGFKWKFA